MILYPKGNSMLLNAFLTLFGEKVIFTCSQRQNIKIVHYKIAKKHPKFGVFFGDFLVNNFDILLLRARKNNIFTKIMLETCSVTSNYP